MKRGMEGENGITRCLCQTNVMPPFCSKVNDAVFFYRCSSNINVNAIQTSFPVAPLRVSRYCAICSWTDDTQHCRPLCNADSFL